MNNKTEAGKAIWMADKTEITRKQDKQTEFTAKCSKNTQHKTILSGYLYF